MDIDKDLLSVALSKAIAEAVPAETRNEIFRRALENHLFAPSRNGGETPVREAFTRALNEQASLLAVEMMKTPEFRNRIKASIAEAFEKTWEGFSAKFTQKIESALRW